MSYRRFEIYLNPRKGGSRGVPSRIVSAILDEIREKTGRAWGQRLYGRANFRVYSDVKDSASIRKFFKAFVSKLGARHQQIEVWMATFPVEVL